MSRRKKWGRIILGSLGILILAGAGFIAWQPWEYDLVPKSPPDGDPGVEPEPEKLFAKGVRVALVAAHPDDPEFYAGGVLTKLHKAGAEIHLILATDGDKGYYPFEDAARNSRVRRREQEDAGTAYSAKSVTFLEFPDGRVRLTDQLVSAIQAQLLKVKPDYVLGFDPEFPGRRRHRDHRVVGEATWKAVQQGRIGEWYLGFMTDGPNFAVDITDVWEQKKKLLALHKSQFSGERYEFIVSLVEGFARRYGRRIGVQLAEGFRVRRAS